MVQVSKVFGFRFFGSVERFTYEGNKICRPTWDYRKKYRLTAEHRHQMCVHLAAHASISNMGEAGIYMLAVPPEGVRSWTITERKTRSLGKIWGLCSTSDFLCDDMLWDEDRQKIVADRAGWESQIQIHYSFYRDRHASKNGVESPISEEEFLDQHRRIVRAHACGALAGHIADGITAGIDASDAVRLSDRRDTQFVGMSDLVVAQGLTDLLPPGEYENAVRVTEEALRRPEVWNSVNRLAGELEKFGLLEHGECEVDIYECLPNPVPEWPPAPGIPM